MGQLIPEGTRVTPPATQCGWRNVRAKLLSRGLQKTLRFFVMRRRPPGNHLELLSKRFMTREGRPLTCTTSDPDRLVQAGGCLPERNRVALLPLESPVERVLLKVRGHGVAIGHRRYFWLKRIWKLQKL